MSACKCESGGHVCVSVCKCESGGCVCVRVCECVQVLDWRACKRGSVYVGETESLH